MAGLGETAATPRRTSIAIGVAALLVLLAGGYGLLRLRSSDRVEVLSVAQAAGTTAAAGTARVTYSLPLGRQGTIELSGPVDFEHRTFAMKGSIGGRAYEIIGIGSDRWSRTPETQGADRPWMHVTDPSATAASRRSSRCACSPS